MSTQQFAGAVTVTGAAGVVAGIAAAAGAVASSTLVTAAYGVGLVYLAVGAAAIAIARADRRTLAAPAAVAVAAGVVAAATQLLLVTERGLVDVLLGRAAGLGLPTSSAEAGVAFGSLALALALAFPLGLSWRRHHRWLLSGLLVATTLPLAAAVATALTSPATASADAVLTGVFVGGIVLLAAGPPFELGRRLRRPGWSGVTTLPLFLAATYCCALQVVALAVGFALQPADVPAGGTLTLVLVALGPVLLLAARGYHAAAQRRTPPSARGG